MCERYALVSSQSGVPARFFIFDTQDENFLAHGFCQKVDNSLNWLILDKNKPEDKCYLIVRSGRTPEDLIASLGLSQFFIQFKNDSGMYAVNTYNKEKHLATIEFAGSTLDVNLDKEFISAIWIKEPYTFLHPNNNNEMERMTKLMIFNYAPVVAPDENDFAQRDSIVKPWNWSEAINPWNWSILKK